MQGNTLNSHTLLTSGVGLKGQIMKLCRFNYILFNLSTKSYLTCFRYDLNDIEDELQVLISGILFCILHVSLK